MRQKYQLTKNMLYLSLDLQERLKRINMAINIPYNSKLLSYAKNNRSKGILCEVILWDYIKNRKFNSLKFDRQKVIGNYIVDFCCIDTGVVIEIDGHTHNDKQDKDHERDNYMKELGLEVIRVQAVDILRNMDNVAIGLSLHPLLHKPIIERKCVFHKY